MRITIETQFTPGAFKATVATEESPLPKSGLPSQRTFISRTADVLERLEAIEDESASARSMQLSEKVWEGGMREVYAMRGFEVRDIIKAGFKEEA